jgi:hypothetical protein
VKRKPRTNVNTLYIITIEPGTEMGRQVAIVLYVVAMAAVIVGVDFDVLQNPILGTADSEWGLAQLALKPPSRTACRTARSRCIHGLIT